MADLRRLVCVLSAVSAAVVVAAACSSDDSGGTDAAGSTPGGGTAGDAATGTGGGGAWTPTDGGPIEVVEGGVEVTDDAGTYICYPTTCAEHLLQCGNCEDDDGDGLIDSHDPECLGPCDNTEGPGLYSDVGGAVGNSCGVDCYFDYGNGPGNDSCIWDHGCDPLVPEASICPYDESLVGLENQCPAEQPEQCREICLPYTPNGCDCFGCCTFPELATAGPNGSTGYVWIGALDADNVSTCTFSDITDTDLCPPCTPIDNCLNACGPCEVCIGRPLPPPECFPTDPDAGPPPGEQCGEGGQPCGLEGQAPCSATQYCISGCCVTMVE
jgi:hypothetical protein